jgi:hypothetical protein
MLSPAISMPPESRVGSSKQFGFFVEGRRDKNPRQNDRKNPKRMNFGVMPQA